jgi:hemerythrin superfamily protein
MNATNSTKISNQAMQPLHDASSEDAIDMLIADHKRVADLFADFRQLTEEGRDDEKARIVEDICRELTLHTQLEEEVFYPAVREAIDDAEQMDEALVEHAGAKQLISELRGADPAEDLYDAKVTVLAEQIEHHVEEEEGSMFPKARYSGVDTLELGAAMLARKTRLLGGDERLPPTPPRAKATKRPARRKSSSALKKRPR